MRKKKNKETYRSTWNEISVGEWERITEVVKNDDLDELAKNSALLSIVTKREDIESLPLDEYLKLVPTMKFLSTPIEKNKLCDEYMLGNHLYTLIKKEDKITAGAFIDFTNLLKNADNEINERNITQVIALVLKPVDDDIDYSQTMQDVDEYMSIRDALAIAFFLTKRYKKRLGAFRSLVVKTLMGMDEIPLRERIKLGVTITKTIDQVKSIL